MVRYCTCLAPSAPELGATAILTTLLGYISAICYSCFLLNNKTRLLNLNGGPLVFYCKLLPPPRLLSIILEFLVVIIASSKVRRVYRALSAVDGVTGLGCSPAAF